MSSNLPPGVTNSMIEAQFASGPCQICGVDCDECLCPECPVCQSYGDPKCYREHGLTLSKEQIIGWHKLQLVYAEEAVVDAGMALHHVECEFAVNDAKPEDYMWIVRHMK